MSFAKTIFAVLFVLSMASGFLFLNCSKPNSRVTTSSSPSFSEKTVSFAAGVHPPNKLKITSASDGLIDIGWNGFGFNKDLPSGVVTGYAVHDCEADANGQVKRCRLSGPRADPDPKSPQNTRRCTRDTSTKCYSENDVRCTGKGSCKFFAGGPLVSWIGTGGNIGFCAIPYFDGNQTGSIDLSTGRGQIDTMPVHTMIYDALYSDSAPESERNLVCPRCNIGGFSGNKGHCIGGTRPNAPCEIHATGFENGRPYTTSLDCPTTSGSQSSIDINLGPIGTGHQSIKISEDSPNALQKVGNSFQASKVFSGVCNDENRTPCTKHASCLLTGGTQCEVKTMAFINACTDPDSCVGFWPSSTPNRPMGYCTDNSNFTAGNLCIGGVESETPEIARYNEYSVTGIPGVPRDGRHADVVFASVFPVGFANSIINGILGLPGPGRVYQPAEILVYTPPTPAAFTSNGVCPVTPRTSCLPSKGQGTVNIITDFSKPENSRLNIDIFLKSRSQNIDLLGPEFRTSDTDSFSACVYDDQQIIIEEEVRGGLLCGPDSSVDYCWNYHGGRLNADLKKFPINGIIGINITPDRLSVDGRGVDLKIKKPLPLSGKTVTAQFYASQSNTCWTQEFSKITMNKKDHAIARP